MRTGHANKFTNIDAFHQGLILDYVEKNYYEAYVRYET